MTKARHAGGPRSPPWVVDSRSAFDGLWPGSFSGTTGLMGSGTKGV
jgi:hypothetical protein